MAGNEQQDQQQDGVGLATHIGTDAAVLGKSLAKTQDRLSKRATKFAIDHKEAVDQLEADPMSVTKMNIAERSLKRANSSRYIAKIAGGAVSDGTDGMMGLGISGKIMNGMRRSGWWLAVGGAVLDVVLGASQNGTKGAVVAAVDAPAVIVPALAGGATGSFVGAGVGWLGGAAVGAAIGSFIPGIGTAVGAAVGATWGMWGAGIGGGLIGGGAAADWATKNIVPWIHKQEKGTVLELEHPNKTSADYIDEGLGWVGRKIWGGAVSVAPSAVTDNLPSFLTPASAADAPASGGGDTSAPNTAETEAKDLNSRSVVSRMQPVEGMPRVRMLLMLDNNGQTDKEGKPVGPDDAYKPGIGGGTKYMAIVKQVWDPKTQENKWVEVKRVPDPMDVDGRIEQAHLAMDGGSSPANSMAAMRAGQAGQPAYVAPPPQKDGQQIFDQWRADQGLPPVGEAQNMPSKIESPNGETDAYKKRLPDGRVEFTANYPNGKTVSVTLPPDKAVVLEEKIVKWPRNSPDFIEMEGRPPESQTTAGLKSHHAAETKGGAKPNAKPHSLPTGREVVGAGATLGVTF